MKKIFFSLVTIFLFISCNNMQVNNTQPQPIVNISEVSTNQYLLDNLFQGQGLTLGFDEQGRIFGYSGLNRFFGKANIENGNIEVSTLASTRMGGSREAMIRENQYLSLLKSMTKIVKENGKLILTNDKGETLIFVVDTSISE